MSKNKHHNDPPLFHQWKHWYWFVITVLVLLIIFFNWFTQQFA